MKKLWKKDTLVERSFSYDQAEKLRIQSAGVFFLSKSGAVTQDFLAEHELGGSPSIRIRIAPVRNHVFRCCMVK